MTGNVFLENKWVLVRNCGRIWKWYQDKNKDEGTQKNDGENE